jgi:16S rRNA (cytosine1402-N4)-methyltransferase
VATFDLPYHIPVMAQACIEGLNIRPNGTYVDVTFGGGGHSRLILDQLDENGRLFAFDQDPDAHENALNDPRFTLIPANFAHLKRFLKLYGATEIDGLLGDLGVSSHQFDVPERGFTFRAAQSPLDMRMNPADDRTAADLLNSYELRALTTLFREFAELSNAFQVANSIVYQREIKPFETAGDLVNALEKQAPRDKNNQFFARVFQALRMEVNQELEVLKNLLLQSTDILAKNGRLVIISYHSLEDRLVKNFFRAGNFEGKVEKDFFGNDLRPLRPLHAKALVPSDEELIQNPRSRSAKLRIAEK